MTMPLLSPDEMQGGDEKRYSQTEMQQLLDKRLSEEKQRYEAALQESAAARAQAENALHAREEELLAHTLRQKALDALQSRRLPSQLLGTLDISSEETLARTLAATETAFRAALEEGVRDRLRGQAPGLVPLPQKTHKPRTLSYQEAVAGYLRDRRNQ